MEPLCLQTSFRIQAASIETVINQIVLCRNDQIEVPEFPLVNARGHKGIANIVIILILCLGLQKLRRYNAADVVRDQVRIRVDKVCINPAVSRIQQAYVTQALETLNIQHLRDRMFMNISGGERQLVLVARALAQQAGILFMDEPTANLDYGNQVRVLEQVRRLAGSGYTVIQSTHNPEQAFLYADEVLAVRNGTIAAHGSPNQVMDAALIRDLYGIEAQVESLMDDRIRVCIPVSSINMP